LDLAHKKMRVGEVFVSISFRGCNSCACRVDV